MLKYRYLIYTPDGRQWVSPTARKNTELLIHEATVRLVEHAVISREEGRRVANHLKNTPLGSSVSVNGYDVRIIQE